MRNSANVELMRALEAWQCEVCGKRRPRIYSTKGPIRYVRCRGCGATGKIVVETRPGTMDSGSGKGT